MNYITNAMLSYRREHLQNVVLTSTYSQYLSADRNRLGPDFKTVLVETFNNAWFKQPVQQSLFAPFGNDDGDGNGGFMIDVAKNRCQAERIDNVSFDSHAIKVEMLRNVDITGEAGVTFVDENKRISLTRNVDEQKTALDRFYKGKLGGYEKSAVKTLHSYMDELISHIAK